MRILQVCPYYHPELQFGGPPQKIHALSQGLIQRGYDCSVLTFHSAHPRLRERIVVDGVKVQYLPWKGRGLWQCPFGMDLLRESVSRAEIVHCYGLYDLLCPVVEHYARRYTRPYIIEPMGMLVIRSGRKLLKTLYHGLITKRAAKRSAAMIATSLAELKELECLGAPRLIIRRNGLDLSRFKRLPPGDMFRKRLHIPSSDAIVLFLGRISPIKNLEQLIRAFDRACLPDTVLVLAGPANEPEYSKRLATLVNDRNLGKRVIFPGPFYGEEQLGALSSANLFVLPSLSESFGNAAAEAVAAGLPVLLTEGCGIAPLIDKRAGLSVPCNEESLALGLRTLLTDLPARSRLTKARSEVLKELTWEEPLNTTEELYNEVHFDRIRRGHKATSAGRG